MLLSPERIHGTFNIFRVAGDFTHAAALLLAFYKVAGLRSAKELSLKTQVLYLLVFLSRYLDIFWNTAYTYNTMFKVFFLLITPSLCILLYLARPANGGRGWRSTYQDDKDTFVASFVVLPSLMLAYVATSSTALSGDWGWHYALVAVLWSFSIFLEAFAMLPQYILFYRLRRRAGCLSFMVVALLGGYRMLYMISWIMKFVWAGAYFNQDHVVSFIGGIGNMVFYIDFLLQRFFSESPMAAIVRRIDGRANALAEEIGLSVLNSLPSSNEDTDAEEGRAGNEADFARLLDEKT